MYFRKGLTNRKAYKPPPGRGGSGGANHITTLRDRTGLETTRTHRSYTQIQGQYARTHRSNTRIHRANIQLQSHFTRTHRSNTQIQGQFGRNHRSNTKIQSHFTRTQKSNSRLHRFNTPVIVQLAKANNCSFNWKENKKWIRSYLLVQLVSEILKA